ncbi:vanadium-dependent haloperoxidase [Phycicoccus sp. Soil802]|uniref:vanadium-dependent haloperoxidase n=1 Tax=Phycicoccus sp. Soil802 TaxID=1736414 RepID=UPI00138F5495|nr:vanadium-dependent haloperoxidase [Phycicoccus sp. Soil802]
MGFALTAALGVALSAAAGTPATARQATPQDSSAVLLEWNLRAQPITGSLRPSAHGQTRGIAMVAGAVYDAVNAIDRGHQPYLLDLEALGISPGASTDAAVATAAHHVLVALAPAQQTTLDDALAATLAAVPDGAAEDEGVRAGEAAAKAMLDARQGDGFMAPFTFELGTEAGDWRPFPAGALDPDPWVGNLRPFLMKSQDQFPSSGPNSLTSRRYAKDFNEVKELGSLTSTSRTPAQTKTAIFWQTAPAPLWHGMARDLITRHDLGAADAARLLASMSLAGADGAISCWNDKYHWQFWRPVAAIREADTDSNPATTADPAWLPLFDPSTATTPPLSNPPFPEHPSGHGCVTGATLGAVRAFFGTDKVTINVTSGRYPGDVRTFTRLSTAMDEVIDARVWGGIHFRTADVVGSQIGSKVARWMDKHYFEPVHGGASG